MTQENTVISGNTSILNKILNDPFFEICRNWWSTELFSFKKYLNSNVNKKLLISKIARAGLGSLSLEYVYPLAKNGKQLAAPKSNSKYSYIYLYLNFFLVQRVVGHWSIDKMNGGGRIWSYGLFYGSIYNF